MSLGADDDEHWSLVSSAGAAVTRELRDLLFLCLTKIPFRGLGLLFFFTI